jgi:hypothetical protein
MANTTNFSDEELAAVEAAIRLKFLLNAAGNGWDRQTDDEPYGMVHNLIVEMFLRRYGLDFSRAVIYNLDESGETDVAAAVYFVTQKFQSQ